MRRWLAAATVAALACPAPAAWSHGTETAIRGPADNYVYELAKPGTYGLPRIRQAGDGQVLDAAGRPGDLASLLAGHITVLAFIYTRCGDVCPLATMRIAELRDMAANHPAVAPVLRLITLSFDPDHDTPEVMAAYGDAWRGSDAAPPWEFLTTSGREALRPILAAYDQPVSRKVDLDDPGGPLSHLMRAFLIDREGQVRNIYSADFLDARLLMNDVLTLMVDR